MTSIVVVDKNFCISICRPAISVNIKDFCGIEL